LTVAWLAKYWFFADSNKLVKVTDVISATTLPSATGWLGRFETIRSARAGEVLFWRRLF
jgi:hypothetical protein